MCVYTNLRTHKAFIEGITIPSGLEGTNVFSLNNMALVMRYGFKIALLVQFLTHIASMSKGTSQLQADLQNQV